MNVDNSGHFPRIRLHAADSLSRCPKCNSLLKKIEVKVPSGNKYVPMIRKFVWGCLGWNTRLHCRTQFEDYKGYPDFNRELEKCY